MKKFKKYESILKVVWQDAAYSNKKRVPQGLPPMQITFGVFLGETREAINIGMNCHWENKKVTNCRDSFIIPKKVIENIKRLGNVND